MQFELVRSEYSYDLKQNKNIVNEIFLTYYFDPLFSDLYKF